MATLYELTLQAAELYEMLQSEDIDEQVFNDTLEAMGSAEKIENYCKIIKQLQNDGEMYKTEIARLTERKRTIENSAERMKKALLSFLQATGQTKAKGGTFSVSTVSTQAVRITDESLIPNDFISLTPNIEKNKIKEKLKTGNAIPGAELATNIGVRIR